MPTDKPTGGNRTCEMVRRMACSATIRRYTAALPQFQIEPDLPPDLAALLERLDRQQEKQDQASARSGMRNT